MTNLTASEITKLTCLIDGQPRGRLATTTKTVYRLRKALRDAIGDPADAVIDRAMIYETYSGAAAIIQYALPQGALAADPKPAASIPTAPPAAAEPWPTSAPAAAPRRRINISAVAEAAKTGSLPTPPDFIAPTHARFRTKLEGLIALAERGDIDALRAVAINPVSSSPKALAATATSASPPSKPGKEPKP